MFREKRKAESRRQKAEGRRQKAGGRRQEAEGSGQKAALNLTLKALANFSPGLRFGNPGKEASHFQMTKP